MTSILDIPKIYTANAEWMACLTVALIYRRCIPKTWKNYLLTAVEMGGCYFLIRLIQLFCQEHSGLPWLIAMMGVMLVMVADIKLVLGIPTGTAFYIGARAFMWAEFAAALEWQLYHYYTFARNVWKPAAFGMAASILCYALIYVLFYLTESHQILRELKVSEMTVTKQNILFAWMVTFSLFGVSNISYLMRNTPFSGTEVTDIFYIRTLADMVGVIMGQMLHLQMIDMKQRGQKETFENMLRSQYIQFRESKDNIEMINRKYHDLKHQLQILRETVNDEERIAYIDEIQEGIARYEAENKTGNQVLDTVLTSKQSRCLKENITMTVVADGSLVDRLSVMDICAVFGNALDNAIEYEIKVQDPEKKLIHVTVSEKKGFVCILVENYYEGQSIPDGTIPETTKQNRKYHGYGLRSVKYTVEKYGGHINTGIRDNWFRLEMIIPKE